MIYSFSWPQHPMDKRTIASSVTEQERVSYSSQPGLAQQRSLYVQPAVLLYKHDIYCQKVSTARRKWTQENWRPLRCSSCPEPAVRSPKGLLRYQLLFPLRSHTLCWLAVVYLGPAVPLFLAKGPLLGTVCHTHMAQESSKPSAGIMQQDAEGILSVVQSPSELALAEFASSLQGPHAAPLSRSQCKSKAVSHCCSFLLSVWVSTPSPLTPRDPKMSLFWFFLTSEFTILSHPSFPSLPPSLKDVTTRKAEALCSYTPKSTFIINSFGGLLETGKHWTITTEQIPQYFSSGSLSCPLWCANATLAIRGQWDMEKKFLWLAIGWLLSPQTNQFWIYYILWPWAMDSETLARTPSARKSGEIGARSDFQTRRHQASNK